MMSKLMQLQSRRIAPVVGLALLLLMVSFTSQATKPQPPSQSMSSNILVFLKGQQTKANNDFYLRHLQWQGKLRPEIKRYQNAGNWMGYATVSVELRSDVERKAFIDTLLRDEQVAGFLLDVDINEWRRQRLNEGVKPMPGKPHRPPASSPEERIPGPKDN